MMASGLPLLEFDGENIRSTFPQETISTAKPIPQDVGSVLNQLLSDPEKRRKQSEYALNFVSSFSWQKSAKEVESAFLKTVFNKNDYL
jgi:glycosyltransferase involved in cell wall biosynthesis